MVEINFCQKNYNIEITSLKISHCYATGRTFYNKKIIIKGRPPLKIASGSTAYVKKRSRFNTKKNVK